MGATILVVEDEEAIAGSLRALLEDEGYRVVVATDGREALARQAGRRLALVRSDVMLPRIDVRALARAMAADPALRAIPLLLLSAVGPVRQADAPHAAFLANPFNLDHLLALVARLTGR